MNNFEFSGFMPAIKNIEIGESTSMITTEGGLIDGHIIKLTLGSGEEIYYSADKNLLQMLFFLILKTVNT